jgi:hypothetical protein
MSTKRLERLLEELPEYLEEIEYNIDVMSQRQIDKAVTTLNQVKRLATTFSDTPSEVGRWLSDRSITNGDTLVTLNKTLKAYRRDTGDTETTMAAFSKQMIKAGIDPAIRCTIHGLRARRFKLNKELS